MYSTSFERIDRRLATAFLALAAALMVIIFLLGAVLFTAAERQERLRLAQVIAQSMGPGFEAAKRSGEYRMRELAKQIRQDNLGLAYIRVIDAEEVIAHDGAGLRALAQGDAPLLKALTKPDGPSRQVREFEIAEGYVTEASLRVAGGYQDEWVGVLRVGIFTERTSETIARAGLVFGGVLILLLALSWPVVVWLGRRLGAPIQLLARDFEGVMQHSPLHITIENAEGRIEKASATFNKAFGVAPGSAPHAQSVFPQEALQAPVDEHPEVRIRIGDEERVLLMSRFPVLLSPTGAVLRAGMIGADVTAWREDQAERDQLAAAVENTDDQLVITVPNRGVVYANPAFYRQTGFVEAEVLGRRPSGLLLGPGETEASQRMHSDLLLAFTGTTSWRGRIVACKKDGTPYDYDLIMSPILDAEGEVQAQIWVGRDVSKEVQLENQLRQAQKMEAVGRLAGGIAHDFNNLLTVINGVTALLEEEDFEPEQQRNLALVADAGQRAADLTRQLLAFSRRQVLDMRNVDLNEILQQNLPLMSRMLGPKVELTVSNSEEPWTMLGDAGQIGQVLMNLAINAADAMPKGGRLNISTENRELQGRTESDGTEVPDGEYVVLTVADSGHGMDEETQSKIFEPFFTTKDVGKGTGLGLATVHGVVRQCGGYLWVYSALGVGTTFRLAFPRVHGSRDQAVAEAVERYEGQGETIFVIEDEPSTRAVIEKTLVRAGYYVTTASDAEAALAMLFESEVLPDLVLTDLVMPGMGGVALAEAIRNRWPDQPVLFMSGYSADAVELGIEPFSLIQKPPSTPVLLKTIWRALRRPAEVKAG